MTFHYDKTIRGWLLGLMIGSYLLTAVHIVDSFYPINSLSGIVKSVPFLFFGLTSFYYTRQFVKFKSFDPVKECRILGIVSLVSMPFILAGLPMLALILPSSAADFQPVFWTFPINAGLLLAFFGCQIAFCILNSRKIRKGNEGLFASFSMGNIAVLITGIIVIYYVSGIVKSVLAIGVTLQDEPVAIAFIRSFLLFSFGTIIAMAVVYLFLFFFSVLSFLASRERKMLTFREAIKSGSDISKKYQLSFWMGIAISAVFLLVALFSLFQLGTSYLSLATLYAMLLIVRVVLFYWDKHILKKHQDEYARFKACHNMFFFAAGMMFVYLAISIIFGAANHFAPGSDSSAFLAFGIFVPWALFKIFVGVKKYRAARKDGSPQNYIDAYLDILMAIFTLANTVFLIASYINGGKPIAQMELGPAILVLVGIGLVLINYVYCAYVIIKVIVVGVLGVRGKRRAYFEKHHPELAAEEASPLPQEEGETEES